MRCFPHLRRWFLVTFLLSLWLGLGRTAQPILGGESRQEPLVVPVGGSVVLHLKEVEQIAIGDPQIADVVVLSSREVLVNGVKAGTTTLHLWTAEGESKYQVEVRHRPGLEEEIRQAIQLPGVFVELYGGSAILRGQVATEEQRSGAQEIAQLFVDQVVNLITLAPQVPSPSLEELAHRITQALQNPAITVQVFEGQALLQGTVATTSESERAEKIASAFVSKVINAIQVATPPQQVGVEAPPSEQVREIQQALGLPGVKVELLQGAAILRGQVDTETDRQNAEEIALLYTDRVINLLTLAAPKKPSLEELATHLVEVAGFPDLQVEVFNNTIFLRGTVETEEELQQAEKIAQAFAGQVVNLMRMRSTDPTAILTPAELQEMLGERVTVQALGKKVLLKGFVASEAEKEAAEKIAGACFPEVINNLQVQKERLPDAVLEARLQELFQKPTVQVQVAQGQVVLRGTVGSQAEAEGLIQIAQTYSSDVVDMLEVREPPQPTRAEKLNQILEPMGVTAHLVDEVIILQGEVSDTRDLERLEELAEAFGSEVVNMVRITHPSQVKVEVQVLEINRRALKNLGIEWNESWSFGEAIVSEPFERLSPVQGTLHTLLEDGEATLLSAPTLTVISGEEASILVGGRIPIPVTTFLTGTPQGTVTVRQEGTGGFFGGIGQGISWEDYGVTLKVTPTVEGDEVRMELKPEVSSLDKVNAIQIENSTIPAIQTRQSETTVQVLSGQAIVMGGLIKHDVTETVKKFPFLGDLPILGPLFRSKKFERQETELIITVTPTILTRERQ